MANAEQKALKIYLEGAPAEVTQGKLCVAFSATGASLTINGQEYSVDENGIILPANDHPTNLGQRVLKVGQCLRDGTVVLSVDLDNNKALFVPAKIFGGKATFDDQNDIVASVNRFALHGYNDWRRITDYEGKTLADNWDEVAPAELKGSAAPWFWLASLFNNSTGCVRRGGEMAWHDFIRHNSLPVPVVRSGPALSLEI